MWRKKGKLKKEEFEKKCLASSSAREEGLRKEIERLRGNDAYCEKGHWKGDAGSCQACMIQESFNDYKINHNTVQWTEILNKRMDQIKSLEAENQALKEAISKLRVEGGMEAEIAKCFELVVMRDKEIAALQSRAGKIATALEKLLDDLFMRGEYDQNEWHLKQAKQALAEFKGEK